jgi:hypothetical protein
VLDGVVPDVVADPVVDVEQLDSKTTAVASDPLTPISLFTVNLSQSMLT